MLKQLELYNEGRRRAGYRPIKIGIGINTGIVILGTIGGAARMDGTVIGDAVNLAARLERLTKEYRVSILISEYTLYCLDQPELWSIRFLDRTHVRGKQDSQSVYEVFNGDPPPLREAKTLGLKGFEQALAYFHLDDIPTALDRNWLVDYLVTAPDDDAARVYLERCERCPSATSATGAQNSRRAGATNIPSARPTVDTAHQNLLVDMNALARAVNVGAWELTKPPLLAQIQFAAAHDFTIEEELMEQDEYPFSTCTSASTSAFSSISANCAAKSSAVKRIASILAFRVKRLLTDWLINHILSADRHYGHFLHGKRQGSGQNADTPLGSKGLSVLCFLLHRTNLPDNTPSDAAERRHA
jgi:hemerythrin